MKIFVVGSTGVLGRHVVPRLLERGHEVRTVARKQEQVKQLQRIGVGAAVGDILDAQSLKRSAAGCEVALHLATAIPKPGAAQDWAPNDRVRREGTQNLLVACHHAGIRRYVQQSTCFLYRYQRVCFTKGDGEFGSDGYSAKSSFVCVAYGLQF